MWEKKSFTISIQTEIKIREEKIQKKKSLSFYYLNERKKHLKHEKIVFIFFRKHSQPSHSSENVFIQREKF